MVGTAIAKYRTGGGVRDRQFLNMLVGEMRPSRTEAPKPQPAQTHSRVEWGFREILASVEVDMRNV